MEKSGICGLHGICALANECKESVVLCVSLRLRHLRLALSGLPIRPPFAGDRDLDNLVQKNIFDPSARGGGGGATTAAGRWSGLK